MIDKCTFNISELENNLHIQKNLTVSANGIFKSGIILGNSNINSTVTELGTIRYSGLDIEGYLDGTWKSLTSGGSGGGSSGSSKSNTFQLNNITQTATYLESIIGFSIENSTIVSQIYGNNYQIINSANSFDTLEINISHPNLSTNPLSYSLEIYIDNNLSQTINITIPQNSIETILRTITNLVVQPNNKLQLKIKALDSASEGGDIFISLHNINTTIPTPVENRITSGVINSDVFQLNSITQSYNNLETILGLSLHSTIISQAYIKDYQIITHPNIYNIIEVNISHSNLITNSLSYNLEIYINNSVAQTVNISIPQNSIQTVLVSISELEVKQNDKLQLKIKANNVVSEGGNIFISLHGKNIITTTTTSIQDNFSIEHNLTVSGNGIFNNTINVGELAVSNKIGIGTSTVETSLDINSSLKVFDVLNDVSGYVNTSDGDYMKLQSTSRTDTNTKKNIILNSDGGYVGIGTNNPQYKLDVDGDINISASNKLRIGKTEFTSSGINTTTINFSQTDLSGSFGESTYSTLLPTPVGFLETTITPSSNSSSTKILISVNVVGEFIPFRPENTMFYLERTINSKIGPVRTYLRSTQIQSNTFLGAIGIASPSICYQNETTTTMESCRFQYIDTPETTDTITYRLMYETREPIIFILNRCVLRYDNVPYSRESGVSCFVAEELPALTYNHIQTDILNSYSGSGPYAISSMNTTITPNYTSDKVKISVSVFGEFTSTGFEFNHMFLLQRQVNPNGPLPPAPVFLRTSSTAAGPIGIAPATICWSNSTTTGIHLYMEYIDEPSTILDVKYTLFCDTATVSTFKLNSTASGGVGPLEERGVSTMISQLLPTTMNYNFTQVDTEVSYTPTAVRIPFPITALSTTITPTSTTNKYIKITAHIVGEWSNFPGTYNSMFLIKRTQNSIDTFLRNESCINIVGPKGISPCNITYHNDADTTIDYCKIIYIDKVTDTSAITYTVFAETESTDYIFKINSVWNTQTNSGKEKGMSNIIVEEVEMG